MCLGMTLSQMAGLTKKKRKRGGSLHYTSRLQYFSQWPYLGRLFICREVSNQMGPSPTIGSQGRQQLRR